MTKAMHMRRKHTILQDIQTLTTEEDDDDGIQANIIHLHSKSTSMRHDDNVPLMIKMLKLFLGYDLENIEGREMT